MESTLKDFPVQCLFTRGPWMDFRQPMNTLKFYMKLLDVYTSIFLGRLSLAFLSLKMVYNPKILKNH